MTGSGKTGLCLALLEEAAIDGIPAIVIDPKGDLANLLLTFPELAARGLPALDQRGRRARRRARRPTTSPRSRPSCGRRGSPTGARTARASSACATPADFAIYTPGSNAGLPVSILKSFAAPPRGDPRRRRAASASASATTATSLLGLLGIDADPIQSREHILLVDHPRRTPGGGTRPRSGRADPRRSRRRPSTRIGVLDLESFFPAKDRFALAMQLNNLLASPGFEAWLEGEPLDIEPHALHARGQAAHRRSSRSRI